MSLNRVSWVDWCLFLIINTVYLGRQQQMPILITLLGSPCTWGNQDTTRPHRVSKHSRLHTWFCQRRNKAEMNSRKLKNLILCVIKNAIQENPTYEKRNFVFKQKKIMSETCIRYNPILHGSSLSWSLRLLNYPMYITGKKRYKVNVKETKNKLLLTSNRFSGVG